MKWSILLILAGLCLGFQPISQPGAAQPAESRSGMTTVDAAQPGAAQSDILQQPITLSYQEATLPQILRSIRDQYQIKFAYLNNEMPDDQTFSVQADDQPLSWVLNELLRDTGLSYQVVNQQIVIQKDLNQAPTPPAQPKPVRSGEASHPSTSQDRPKDRPVPPPTSSSEELPTLGSSGSVQDDQATHPLSPTVVAQPPVTIIGDTTKYQKRTTTSDSLLAQSVDTSRVSLAPSVPPPTNDEVVSPRQRNQSALDQKISQGVRNAVDKLMQRPTPDSSDYIRRPFHIGLIYPLSSNGTQAGRMVNGVSLHLLVGYAAGLEGVEFSAFGNIENDFVQGAQFAGFFNLVKHRVDGVQAAGFVNVNGGNTEGAQLAGFVNVGAGEVSGVQGAGFANIATGHQQGAQLSGFANLLSDSIRGVQGTGFINIATGGVHGAQLSGFANYASRVKGIQATGFVNVVSGDVQGGQVAGFVNYAHHVKGAQIGLLNIADSIDGVPIGLVSIVRKNGYRRLELWYGEALQANIAFKMGVPKFYNMLVFGTQFADTDFRWGVGYGVGTFFPITSAFSMNLDLFAMQIHEDNQRFFHNYSLNLLNTLRLSFNLNLSERIVLFVAPTFNVMVSEYRQPDSGIIGSPVAPSWTNYDQTFNNQTNLTMWPGFHVGLRF